MNNWRIVKSILTFTVVKLLAIFMIMATAMSPFEILMILSFGAAWPFSIYRSWKSRSTQGKSPLFLAVILVGYIAGLLHKIFYSMDPVILLYGLNTLMVSTDILLFMRNRKFERASGQ